MQNTIERVRAFNRLYMPAMKLLGNSYLGSEYSATEARVIFEIHEKDGCNAAYIASRMNIDKSYLSRILSGYEREGYIHREPSGSDRRSISLHLTDKGKARAEEFIALSDKEIGSIIGHLSEREQEELVRAMDRISMLLMKGDRT